MTASPSSSARSASPQASGGSPRQRVAAWSVHAFTASGGVLGTLALLAIDRGAFDVALLLMLATMFIDSVDGTLARRVEVRRVLPGIDGRRLDDVVDFLTFVVVPLVFLDALGALVGWWVMVPAVMASAYGFAREDAKTEDDFFLGWPSYWNVVAIYVYLLHFSPWTGTALVLLFSAAIFVPVKYVYPSKVKVLWKTTNGVGMLWAGVLIACILWPEALDEPRVAWWTLVYPVYYFGLSIWLGDWFGIRRRAAPT